MTQPSRSAGIDVGRVLALLAIVALHSYPNFSPTPFELVLWDQLPRFAVPFFFISSGYFLWRKVSKPSAVARSLVRILTVFIFWVVVYNITTPEKLAPASWLGTFLWAGNGFHLWFLSALVMAIMIAVVLVNLLGLKATCVIATGLFVAGVMAGAYKTAFWTFTIGTRNGVYFGLPFVTMGMAIANWNIRLNIKLSAPFFALAAALQVAESIFARGSDIHQQGDFFFSTSLYGLSSFLLFASLNGTVISWIGSLGKYVLGAFAVHAIFLWVLSEGGYWGLAGWGAFISLTFIYSMAFAAVASKVPLLKRVVT